jgi:hypothetical protein
MKFEEALPLMRKGIVCICDGVSWTVNEKHEWLRWYGTSSRIDSGPSNDQILGGEWEREGGAQGKSVPAEVQVFAPKPNLDRLEARLAYLERLHDVVHRDGPIEPPSYRQTMKHIGDLWRDEA